SLIYVGDAPGIHIDELLILRERFHRLFLRTRCGRMTVGDEEPCFHSRDRPEQSQAHDDSYDDIHDALPLHFHLTSPYVVADKACATRTPLRSPARLSAAKSYLTQFHNIV